MLFSWKGSSLKLLITCIDWIDIKLNFAHSVTLMSVLEMESAAFFQSHFTCDVQCGPKKWTISNMFATPVSEDFGKESSLQPNQVQTF